MSTIRISRFVKVIRSSDNRIWFPVCIDKCWSVMWKPEHNPCLSLFHANRPHRSLDWQDAFLRNSSEYSSWNELKLYRDSKIWEPFARTWSSFSESVWKTAVVSVSADCSWFPWAPFPSLVSAPVVLYRGSLMYHVRLVLSSDPPHGDPYWKQQTYWL